MQPDLDDILSPFNAVLARSDHEGRTVGYIEMSYFRELLDVIEKRKRPERIITRQ